jgi:hypothetical protein
MLSVGCFSIHVRSFVTSACIDINLEVISSNVASGIYGTFAASILVVSNWTASAALSLK